MSIFIPPRWLFRSLVIALFICLLGPVPHRSDLVHAQSEEGPAQLQEIELVAAGQAHAAVLFETSAEERTIEAAHVLSDYVEQATGERMPVLSVSAFDTDPSLAHLKRVYVGTSGVDGDPNADNKIAGLDDDGFGIFPYQDTVAILGPTSWGTQFGVYEFLERYVGVRWLLPGEDGVHIPQMSRLAIPVGDVIQEPSFQSRIFSPINENGKNSIAAQKEWSQFNRMHIRHSFHHNLYNMFPPSVYGETHPEYYPSVPANDSVGKGWQPCLTPATAAEAISIIRNYFDQNPDATHYSLGVNDSEGFCEENPKDIYYAWVNGIVENVLLTHPGKQFGLIAYQQVKQPPSFPLNPNIIVYITRDRWNWIDPARKVADMQLHTEWQQVATQIGWYDYLNGNPYLLPRIYTDQMSDNYKLAAVSDVTGHYAELYPNWGEGPKAWISSKLQWDANLDAEQLAEEWYELAVGSAAAPYLQAYYDYWEHFWTVRIQSSPFFRSPNQLRADYLDLVTEQDMALSRSLLENAILLAHTDKQRARANLLLTAFEYYEASVLSYPLTVEAPATETEALAMLEQASSSFTTRLLMGEKRFELLEQFKTHPVLVHLSSPLSKSTLLWTGYNLDELGHLSAYIRTNESSGGAVTNRLMDLAAGLDPSSRDYAKLLLAAVAAPNLIQNPSFETGDVQAPPWTVYKTTDSRTFHRSEDESLTGQASMRVYGTGWGGPSQKVPGSGGFALLRVKYKTVSEVVYDRDVIQVGVNLLDEHGEMIKQNSVRSDVFPLSAGVGQWATAYLNGDVQDLIGSVPVRMLEPIILVESDHPIEVFLDDAELYNFPLASGAGVVTGTVYGDGMAPLTNAYVTVTGTSYGVFTDLEGRYAIADVPYGQHTLTVSHTSHDPHQTASFTLGKWEKKDIPVYLVDVFPPELTASDTSPASIGTKIRAVSSEDGALYLAHEDIPPVLAALEAVATTVSGAVYGVKTTVQSQVYGALDTIHLSPGWYKVYAADASGNLSEGSAPIQIMESALPHSLTAHPSFEDADGTAAAWSLSPNATQTRNYMRTENAAYAGTASLLVTGVGHGGPAQTIDARPGQAKVSIRYKPNSVAAGNNNIGIGLYLLDANGKNVYSTAIKHAEYITTATPRIWHEASWTVDIPETFPGTSIPVASIRAVVLVYSINPLELYVDDVGIVPLDS